MTATATPSAPNAASQVSGNIKPSSKGGQQVQQTVKTAKDIYVNLNDVYINKAENVREARSYTDEDFNEMEAQIRAAGGLIHPIVVAPIPPQPQTQNKHYVLIDGYRRSLTLLRMAEAGEPQWAEKVQAKETQEADSVGTTKLLQLLVNMARRNLNNMEIAVAVKQIMEDKSCDFTQKDVSAMLGRSEENISQVMKLNQLPPQVQEMVSTGKLSFSHARVLMSEVPQSSWMNYATKGCDMDLGDFEDLVANDFGNKEATGAAGTTTGGSQKPAKMIRATDLQGKYIPYLTEQVEKADGSNKTFTAKDLANARLDSLKTVLLNQETGLAKEIAPHLEKLKQDEEKAKAEEKSLDAEHAFFKKQVKRLEELLDAPVDPNNPTAQRPSLAAVVGEVGKEIMSIPAEARKELGFDLDKITADSKGLAQKILTTYQEVITNRDESRKKREENAKKKAEAEAAAAANGETAAAPPSQSDAPAAPAPAGA